MGLALLACLVSGAALAAGQQAPGARRTLPTLLAIEPRAAAEPVAAGQRFQVTLDLTPAPGIHVYAPEVRNYRPIALTLKTDGGVRLLEAPRYPAAESYYYAPLQETVPVYQKPFRITQDVSLDGAKPGSTVTIAGVLSYQACDARLCYPPRTSAVTWNVRISEAP